MTVTTNGHERPTTESPADLWAAATQTYWLSVAAGTPVTGADLAERYSRSDRWGRRVIQRARDDYQTLSGVDDGTQAETTSKAELAARAVRVAAVAVVVAAAAAVSFDHHREVALAAGEGWRAWLLPLSIDGMLVVASITAWERKRAGQLIGGWVWTSLTLGIIASIAGNMAAAEPTLDGRLIASWPPLALKLSLAMLLTTSRPRSPADRDIPRDIPPPETDQGADHVG